MSSLAGAAVGTGPLDTGASMAPEKPLSGAGIALAALASLGIWWTSTVVLVYFNLVPSARPVVFVVSLGLAVWSARWLYLNQNNRTVAGAYMQFTTGLLVWAFVQASFYTGFIVGPDLPLAEPAGPSLQSLLAASAMTRISW